MMGRLPKRQDTQIADVLARLLSGQRLTALDALRESSAFRLAAIIHKLRHSYGWAGIQTADVSVECADGRAAQVAEYGLPAPVAVAARSRNEVASWMSDVLSSRAASARAA